MFTVCLIRSYPKLHGNSIHFTLLTPFCFKTRISIISPSHTIIPRGHLPTYIQSNIKFAFSFLLNYATYPSHLIPILITAGVQIMANIYMLHPKCAVTCIEFQLISSTPRY